MCMHFDRKLDPDMYALQTVRACYFVVGVLLCKSFLLLLCCNAGRDLHVFRVGCALQHFGIVSSVGRVCMRAIEFDPL